MPTLDVIDAEIGRIATLPRNEFGVIADTYDTLHSVIFLKEIGRNYLVADDGSQDFALTLTFCSDLISCNIIKLLRKARAVLVATGTPPPEPLSAPMLWIQYLLNLSSEIGDAVLLQNLPSDDSPEPRCELLNELLAEYQSFCADVNARLVDEDIMRAVESGYTDNDCAVFVHTLKIVSAGIRFHAGYRLKCERFDQDYYRYVKECVDCISSSEDTYLDQFRLLHQIPEALSAIAAEMVQSAIGYIERGEIPDAVRVLTRVGLPLDMIISSLQPLVELMYPSEYFKFRMNLGGTSGSQSQGLGGRLLRSLYAELS